MRPTEKPPGPEPPPLKEAPKFEGLKRAFGSGEAGALAQASAVGLTFVVAILLGLGLGWWLDRKLGTAPWLLLLGLLIGIAAGFKNLFSLAGRPDRQDRISRRPSPRPNDDGQAGPG
ncbi:MAG: AtpZ/AtpI family protein [Candidatus Adiutrix sp.]|jgi:ATP synthase protein I|nr:AtpZ/AtpI family protein [Candidatus Adiutrix sp.]